MDNITNAVVDHANASDDIYANLTASIVRDYVTNNKVDPSDLPALIQGIRNSLGGTVEAKQEVTQAPESTVEPIALKPAVNPKKSVHNDYIICLEDGKHFKSLKRHLAVHYNMTPDEYRAKWGLAANYPMVAPSYSEARSRMAKDAGFGRMTAKERAERKQPKVQEKAPTKAKANKAKVADKAKTQEVHATEPEVVTETA